MYVYFTPALFVNKRGKKKTIQLYTKSYILRLTLLTFSALNCVGFVSQTLHKPCTKLYTVPYTKLYTEPYTNTA